MSFGRPALFRKRQFEPAVIVTCVRWYLRFSLSLRDVEELMAERNLSVDHTTVWRWVQVYAPEIRKRLQGQLKYKRTTWIADPRTRSKKNLDGCDTAVQEKGRIVRAPPSAPTMGGERPTHSA
jgi:hypothetical protein